MRDTGTTDGVCLECEACGEDACEIDDVTIAEECIGCGTMGVAVLDAGGIRWVTADRGP